MEDLTTARSSVSAGRAPAKGMRQMPPDHLVSPMVQSTTSSLMVSKPALERPATNPIGRAIYEEAAP